MCRKADKDSAGIVFNLSDVRVRPAKWNAFEADRPQTDLYPLLVVAVQREQASGPFSIAEFTMLREAAHAPLEDMVAATDEHSPTIHDIDQPASAGGYNRSTQRYEQTMQGIFQAPSETPSLSFVMTAVPRSPKQSMKGLCISRAIRLVSSL